MAEYLISRGADVNKVTFAGNTPLHTASGREMDQMAKLLMTHGANVNIANLEGDIPRVVRSSEQVNRCAFRGSDRAYNNLRNIHMRRHLASLIEAPCTLEEFENGVDEFNTQKSAVIIGNHSIIVFIKLLFQNIFSLH